jgi:hypothetical protein
MSKPLLGDMNGPMSYAAAAARGVPLAGTYNTQSLEASSVQRQREVILNIGNQLILRDLLSNHMGQLSFGTRRPLYEVPFLNINIPRRFWFVPRIAPPETAIGIVTQ